MTELNMLILFLHIAGAIAWIGGLFYLRFIVLPVLMAAAPTVRGPVLVELGPRSVRMLLRVAELTIVAGVVSFFLLGGFPRMASLWGQVLGLGFVLAVAIYIIGQVVIRPVAFQVADTIKAMAAGQAQEDAPALLMALGNKQRRAMNIQLGLAVIVVITMAIARFA